MISRKSIAILAVLILVLGVAVAQNYAGFGSPKVVRPKPSYQVQVTILQCVVAPTDNYDATTYDDTILVSDEPAGKQVVLPVTNVAVGKMFVISNAVGSNDVILTTADNGNSLEFGAATMCPGTWASVVWTGTQYRYVMENL
jgi:hypothetical protein